MSWRQQVAGEAEALLETVLAGAPVGVALLDRELRYVRINAYLADLNGAPVEAHLGRTITDVIPAVAPTAIPALQHILDTGEPLINVEIDGPRIGRPDEPRTWLLSAYPVRAQDGTVLGVGVITTEVTEQKRAQQAAIAAEAELRGLMGALSESRELLTVAEELAHIGSWALDLGTGRLTWSDELFRIVGRAPQSTPPTVEWFVAHVHPEDRAALHAAFERVVQTGDAPPLECRITRPDGSQRTIQARARGQRDASGTIVWILGSAQDVTGHRELESQLRQAQKMEAVGQLAGGIAHDFNNLLTVIRTYSELLIERIEERSPLRSDVVEIQRAAGRAASLTKQLLAFSRKQILKPKVLDLNIVAGDLEPMLRRLIGEDIRVVLRPFGRRTRVRADPGQLEQILINLAVNARDAMPTGGQLTIETGDVHLDDAHAGRNVAVLPGAYAMLAVTDTGTGMDDTTRERAFEPFYTTKEVGKGTGLGLSTVYGIVKQSGGYIWIYSEPGQGTTVKIYLPHVEDAERDEAGRATSAAGSARGSEVVLLVEDEAAVRSLARRLLERQGYTVLEATDGRDGLRVAEHFTGRIDGLVTDMVMPELGGRDLFRTLSGSRPELRVLYMSGYTNDDIVRRGLLESGIAFLQKPFTAASLCEAVRAVLDGRNPPAAVAG